jgi:segregation and condensation protein B
MSDDTLKYAVNLAEAYIFASPDPVPVATLARVLGPAVDVGIVLSNLTARYCQGRGIRLAEAAGGLQFQTAPEFAPKLELFLRRARKMPHAATEVLAVIALHQPVTRSEVEEVRGVSTGQPSFDLLLELGLIAPAGRRETPGHPTQWQTTPSFLSHFGLRSLRDLPLAADLH